MHQIDLSPELERFAETCVASARFESVSAAAQAAFELLQEFEEQRATLLDSLEAANAEGERDGFLTIDEVRAELEKTIAEASSEGP